MRRESDAQHTALPQPIDADRLLSSFPVAAALVASDDRIVWTNDAFVRLLGLGDQPPPLANSLVERAASGWWSEVLERFRRGEQTEQPVQAPLRRGDGSRLTAHARLELVGPADDPWVLVAITPIAAPRFDHQPLRRALELQQELVCEWAPNGVVLYANRAYREFFGSEGERAGHRIDDIVESHHAAPKIGRPKLTPAELRELLLQRVTDDVNPHTTVRQRYTNGRTVEWTTTALYDDAGEILSVFAVGRDVTDRIQAELDLRRSEERFRMMATHIWDTIVLLDANGNLIESTAPYRADLDHTPDFWSERDVASLLHPDDREAAILALADLVRRGPNAQGSVEARARRASGEYTWLELTGTNLLHHPALQAVLLSARNIEERKRYENELAARNERERAALQRQVSFVAQVSHELRNLVHGTLGLSEILARTPLPPSVDEVVVSLHRQTLTLRRIVDDLIDHAQIEAGGVDVREEVLDLEELLRDIVLTTEHQAADGVRISAPLPDPALRYVLGDSDRLRQAILNLVSNAIRHTPEGEIRIVATEGSRDGTVRIEVRDTGTGIDPAEVDRLFLAYQRGAGERSHGIGLGLAIVKAAVESMGGEVGAQSRPGGATFWIELRKSLRTDPTPMRGIPRPPEHLQLPARLRVLVVDDDSVNRLVATMQLEALGAMPTATDSLATARTALRSSVFDAVLCDLNLPDGSALDLVREIRATVVPAPFVIVMTGDADPDRRRAVLQAGADRFLLKPATMHDVATALSQRAAT